MEEQLAKIEEYAAALMSVEEVAILSGVDPQMFKHHIKYNPAHPWAVAFSKGRLTTRFRLRKKIISLAIAGSPQAEVLADKYVQQGS